MGARGYRPVALAAAAAVIGVAVSSVEDGAVAGGITERPPNIVVIVTDDQRWDQLQGMTTLRTEIKAKGRAFTRAFTVDPWCCPSRVSLLRGQYPHSTRIYRLGGKLGGAEGFRANGREQTTIATLLDGAGYRTAMIGKYLNGYSQSSFSRVPPGWDTWRAFATTGAVPYFDYSMSVDGQTVSYGNDPDDYATDVLAGHAEEFIRTTPQDDPLFLYLAPGAPHAPMIPAPRHVGSASCTHRAAPPSVGEADVSDKPGYIADAGWPSTQEAKAAKRWVKSCRTLLAVDEALETVLRALEDTGRLHETLIAYTSDNGYMFGEHRRFGKKVPYQESVHLPLLMRYDPATGGVAAADNRLVVNVDVTATALEVAGVAAPYPLEGMSLVPALTGGGSRREAVLIEHYDPPGALGYVPSYCQVRTRRHAYIRYDAGADRVPDELYDMRSDPFQLENLMRSDQPPLELRDRLLGLMRDLCVPVPPGFDY